MKFKARFLAFLLIASMLLACLASCAPESGVEETTPSVPDTSAEASVTESVETEYQTPSVFDLILNGETEVKIIRPENLGSDDGYVVAAIAIRDSISKITGVRLTMGDDFKRASESYDDSTVEILVGKTAHAQVAKVAENLRYGEYAIQAVGNKIVIMGYTDAAVSAAAAEFAAIVERNKTEVDGKVSVSIPAESLNVIETHSSSEALNSVPVFFDADFVATSTSGTKCNQVILNNATEEEFTAYLSKLESDGYKKYTDNNISGNLFATFYSAD